MCSRPSKQQRLNSLVFISRFEGIANKVQTQNCKEEFVKEIVSIIVLCLCNHFQFLSDLEKIMTRVRLCFN